MSYFPIEAFCASGTVGIPGRGNLLHLSRGFLLRAPETRAATNRVRNQMESCLAHLPGMLAEGEVFMMQWESTNDFGDIFARYAKATPPNQPVAVQRYRNRKAAKCIKAARDGWLRREQVTLWLGQDVSHAPPNREERKDLDTFYGSLLAEHATQTIKLAAPMQAVLAPAGITLEPLDSQDVLTAWHRRLNPSAASRRSIITVPPESVFSLTDLCFQGELRGLGDRGFLLDGEYHKFKVMQRMPSVLYPGILDHLTTLPIPDFTLTVTVLRLHRKWLVSQLQSRLEKIQRQLQRRSDPLLEVTRAQLTEKLAQLARGAIVPLEMKFIIGLHAPTSDELRRHDDLVKGAIARMNGAQFFDAALAATNRNLLVDTMPGWLRGDAPCFAVYGESGYIGSLLPVPNCFEAHLEQAEALFVGPYSNAIGVRLFVGEGKASTPQHCWFSGANGTGKSYFLCWLLTETAPFFQTTYILDYGGSHQPHVEATGGTSLVITPDCPWTFNVFFTGKDLPMSATQRALVAAFVMQLIGVSKDEEKAGENHALLANHVDAVCAEFAEAWLRRQSEAERQRLARHALVLHRLSAERLCEPIEAFIALRDELETAPEQARRRLEAPSDAEVRAFATKHRDALRDLAFAFMTEFPTLSSLYQHLDMAGARDERCRRLAERMKSFCRGGASAGNLFDGQSNVQLTGNRVTRLEMGRLNKSSQSLQSAVWFLMLIVLTQHCLSRPMHERKRIILEEIGLMLQIPNAEAIIKEMFATFRKYNIQCTLVCQQASQLENETLRSVVLGNVRMAFIFSPGDAQDLDRIAQYLPLSEAARAMILKYVRPDQLSGHLYSECCYFHLTSSEAYCGTIRFMPPTDDETKPS